MPTAIESSRDHVNSPQTLLDVQTVATTLACSTRHVYRLCDAGRMPRPLKLGALVRWRKDDIDKWIESGCPSYRKGGAS